MPRTMMLYLIPLNMVHKASCMAVLMEAADLPSTLVKTAIYYPTDGWGGWQTQWLHSIKGYIDTGWLQSTGLPPGVPEPPTP